MLVLPQEVIVSWNINNKQWYESLGYIFTSFRDTFKINANELPLSSDVKVDIKCDYCGKIFPKIYKSYINGRKKIQKDSCKDCKGKKTKEIILLVYGVDCTLKIPEVKQKSKDTLYKNFQVTNPFESEIINNKIKQVNIEKYGVENYTQTEEYKTKSKETNLERYGVEHYNQTQESKERHRTTYQEKYGVDNIFQDEKTKEKIKQTNLEKYGVEYIMQNNDIQEKRNNTNLKRYGFITPLKNKLVQNKIKQTNIIRYGSECVLNNKHIQEKIKKTLAQNGTVKTSSQQIDIYNMLKNNNYNVDLNYPLSNINLDVAIFIDDIKIDLEYDAWNWHQNPQIDRKRDEFTKSQGWKVLRIRSGHKVPTLEQLEESIDKLINTDRTFTQIVLDDWKIENQEVM